MTSTLKFPEGVGDQIAAIGKDGSDLQAITMFLFLHSTTKERFEAVAALDAAKNKPAVIDCVPALKRAFSVQGDRE